jgi:hypothetical protein
MKVLPVRIARYPSVAREIAAAMGMKPPPIVRIGRGRITMTFRQSGGTRWPPEQRIDYAIQAANVARIVCSEDDRRLVRRRANRAVVVVFEDVMLEQGCDVQARWECVVPVQRISDRE